MGNPKVSVCIPTYNAAKYLPEAMESVLSQSYADFELLVIDNCSTDSTADIVNRYGKEDGRIKYFRNSSNIGAINNFNLCLAKASGEYIKFVCADDLLVSKYSLEKMAALLDLDNEISLVSTSRYFIDAASRVIRVMSCFNKDIIVDGKLIINRCLLSDQNNLIGEPTTVMFRRKDTERGFNPIYRQLVDLEMWFYLLEKGKFCYLAEPLSAFRLHQEQGTVENKNSGLVTLIDNFQLVNDYIGKPYIKISGFYKKYINYNNIYRIWKHYKNGYLAKAQTLKEINARYDYAKFLLYYPLYKIYKPLHKLCLKKLNNRL